MENNRILLVGGGGHCRSVLDCILNQGNYTEIGIIDQNPLLEDTILGVPILGRDEDLPRLRQEGWNCAVVTVGSIGNTALRRRIVTNLKQLGFVLPVIIDPSAVIGRNVILDEGSFVGKRAVVNAGTQVGCGAIINTGAVLEHDCVVGSFSHISPGSILCGGVCVGDDTHVGAGSIVRQQIHIGKETLIGAGSVVVHDLPDHVKAYGNPCKVVEIL